MTIQDGIMKTLRVWKCLELGTLNFTLEKRCTNPGLTLFIPGFTHWLRSNLSVPAGLWLEIRPKLKTCDMKIRFEDTGVPSIILGVKLIIGELWENTVSLLSSSKLFLSNQFLLPQLLKLFFIKDMGKSYQKVVILHAAIFIKI